MKILLGNTGRGGEQCIFTSIVHSYRQSFPDAYINVVTCSQYEKLWFNNKDINAWTKIKFLKEDVNQLDAVSALRYYMNTHKNDYDLMELSSECEAQDKGTSTLDKCYEAIDKKVFKLEDVERKIFIYPTEQEIATAESIKNNYPNLILLSHGANSMKHPLSLKGYEILADKLKKYGDVAYIGTTGGFHMPADPEIKGAIDLRDIGWGASYELRKYIKIFIGMETAPAFFLHETKAPMIIMRGDPQFPLKNTGLTPMGYRKKENTHELEVLGLDDDEIIGYICKIIQKYM